MTFDNERCPGIGEDGAFHETTRELLSVPAAQDWTLFGELDLDGKMQGFQGFERFYGVLDRLEALSY